MHNCCVCRKSLPDSEFYVIKDKSRGRLQCRCKKCHNAVGKARYAAAKKIINAIKLEKGCKRCGWNSDPVALDFHHRDRASKLFRLAGHMNGNIQTLMREAAKCDVLCANCHRITHYSSLAKVS